MFPFTASPANFAAPMHTGQPHHGFTPAALSIADIQAQATAAGSHFFAPTMLEAFNSEVYPQVFEGALATCFVTSETCGSEQCLRYTVREFDRATRRIATPRQPRPLRAATLGEALNLAAAYAAGEGFVPPAEDCTPNF